MPSIESVEFHGGGKDLLINIQKYPGSKLSVDELKEIECLFYDFFCHNAHRETHQAFLYFGSIKFNNKDPLDVFHEYSFDDGLGHGLDEFDNFLELEKIIHTALSQNIKELKAINKKFDIDSITLDGYFSQSSFDYFELNDKQNGITLKLTKEIEKAVMSTVANYLKDAADIHVADKTIIDDVEINESEVSSLLSVIWRDSYRLEPVEDYPE